MASSPVHILSRRVIDFLERTQRLAPFQRRFIRGAFADGVDLAALCGPRGLGKSSLSGELLACALDPDGPLHEPGSESILLAGSLDQARAAFRFLRARCPEDKGFKYTDSGQRVSVHHKVTNTRIRVASSDAKRAFGIVGARLVVGDEPAAWQERGGALMFDALSTAGGKQDGGTSSSIPGTAILVCTCSSIGLLLTLTERSSTGRSGRRLSGAIR